MKQKISISIDSQTLEKIRKNILEGKFRNISHAFEYAVNQLGVKDE